jgi:hypothetical protein
MFIHERVYYHKHVANSHASMETTIITYTVQEVIQQYSQSCQEIVSS